MAGSASFRLVANNCCAAGWLAREDPEVEAKVSGASWRTFCWLSTSSVDTHRLVAEAMLPPWRRLLLLQDDRTGMAERRRAREAPRKRGEADMVLCALFFTCKPESHNVSPFCSFPCSGWFSEQFRGSELLDNLLGAYKIIVGSRRRRERRLKFNQDILISSTKHKCQD